MSRMLLAIESSCDDTAVAVVEKRRGTFMVHSQARHSQIAEHQKTNGVVPEVAARSHVTSIMPLVREALLEARIAPQKLDGIAVTRGPGLIPSLLVGVETAKALAYAWRLPLFGVHHIWGHFVSGLLSKESRIKNHPPASQARALRAGELRTGNKNLDSPYLIHNSSWNLSSWRQPTLGLIVSGGHSELLLFDGKKIRCVGRTLDDAAGEAFDKVATLLGLPYPGGPAISALAKKGDPRAFVFPRALQGKPTLDMSFSGLKTAVRYMLEKQEVRIKNQGRVLKADVAASFQAAVIDVLVDRVRRAIDMYKPKTVFVGGGVSANQELRKRLSALSAPTITFPEMQFTQDNAVMIGLGALLAPHLRPTPITRLRAFSRLPIEQWV